MSTVGWAYVTVGVGSLIGGALIGGGQFILGWVVGVTWMALAVNASEARR